MSIFADIARENDRNLVTSIINELLAKATTEEAKELLKEALRRCRSALDG